MIYLETGAGGWAGPAGVIRLFQPQGHQKARAARKGMGDRAWSLGCRRLRGFSEAGVGAVSEELKMGEFPNGAVAWPSTWDTVMTQ